MPQPFICADLYHLFFPVTDDVKVELVRRALEEGDLLGGECDLRCTQCIGNVMFLGHADDGNRALADGPCDGDLGDIRLVLVCEQFEREVQRVDLVHDRVVDCRACRICRHRIQRAVVTCERALFEHHVGEKRDILLAAVVKDTGFLGRAVD